MVVLGSMDVFFIFGIFVFVILLVEGRIFICWVYIGILSVRIVFGIWERFYNYLMNK